MLYKFRKILGFSLIGLGIILISITMYMKYETYKRQQNSLETFKDRDFYGNEEKIYDKQDKRDEKLPIAILKIPKINLEIAVVEGVEQEDIMYLVGHFPDSVMPGEMGNLCVAGHRTSNYGQPFKEVGKLRKGDEIIFIYHNKEYIYIVDSSFTVTPDDTYVLEDTKDEAVLTLVTCTMDSKNRLIIKGHLK